MSQDDPPRVLIVEDEMLLADALDYAVAASGGRTVGLALTSTEAVELAVQTRPDLALVDVHLGDGPTGVDAARNLAEACGAMVLFLTANLKRLPEDYAGACGVMSKPYTDAGLRAALAFLLECVRTGQARRPAPPGLTLAPAFARQWDVPAS